MNHHSNGSNRLVRNIAGAILALGALYAGAASAQTQAATGPDGSSGQAAKSGEDTTLRRWW